MQKKINSEQITVAKATGVVLGRSCNSRNSQNAGSTSHLFDSVWHGQALAIPCCCQYVFLRRVHLCYPFYQASMLRQWSTRISPLLFGMLVARTKSDRCGDTTSQIHRSEQFVLLQLQVHPARQFTSLSAWRETKGLRTSVYRCPDSVCSDYLCTSHCVFCHTKCYVQLFCLIVNCPNPCLSVN